MVDFQVNGRCYLGFVALNLINGGAGTPLRSDDNFSAIDEQPMALCVECFAADTPEAVENGVGHVAFDLERLQQFEQNGARCRLAEQLCCVYLDATVLVGLAYFAPHLRNVFVVDCCHIDYVLGVAAHGCHKGWIYLLEQRHQFVAHKVAANFGVVVRCVETVLQCVSFGIFFDGFARNTE